jgi:formate dehydrogenase subunit gamma
MGLADGVSGAGDDLTARRLAMPLRSRALAIGLAALIVLPSVCARAQQDRDPAPNPTAQSVQEQQLLQQLRRIEGRVTIPDSRAGVLEQPQGREYQAFRERVLPWLGAIALVAMLAALVIFYLVRGPIRLERPPSRIKIKRVLWSNDSRIG